MSGFLGGQILIAMPTMRDKRFRRSLVFLCAHSAEGAMGLILNRQAEDICLGDLFSRLEIPVGEPIAANPVHYGGPVETGRGFVLHSGDFFSQDATLKVDASVSMTATLDILHAMSAGEGPRDAMVALGYSGWAPGQLEHELQHNGWLACPPDHELVFGQEHERKWDRALSKIGVDPSLLMTGGTA
ncbi:MAG: YqgE/AlgH family protein [Pseudomonadota bacterium]